MLAFMGINEFSVTTFFRHLEIRNFEFLSYDFFVNIASACTSSRDPQVTWVNINRTPSYFLFTVELE